MIYYKFLEKLCLISTKYKLKKSKYPIKSGNRSEDK